MANFNDRLNAMRAAQEAADVRKQEEAAEKSQSEREARLDELSKRREAIRVEFTQAEGEAGEAHEALKAAVAFEAEQGEKLVPEAKAEIDAIKLDAVQANEKFKSLQAELAQIDAEMTASGGTTADTAEAAVTPELTPEAAFKKANEAYAKLQSSIREKVRKLDIAALTQEQAKAAIGELKTDRLALLKGFTDLAEKMPKTKDDFQKYTAVNDNADRLFGDVAESVFNRVNEAVDDAARKLNDFEIPRQDYVITRRIWQEQTEFSDAEFEELLKMTGYRAQEYTARGADASAAAVTALIRMRPSRLSESAFQRFKDVAEKNISKLSPESASDPHLKKDISNIRAGILMRKKA